MQKAKQAISNFVSKDGKHTTEVDESTARAVTNEQIRPHQHENTTTAVDKEVHQHHHHTTVQPLAHKEALPEQHTHNALPVQEKTFHHGNEGETTAKLEREAAKFKDTSVTHGTTHSASESAAVTGERVHHHVHEHVQPVVNKEVHAPTVVHTTVPIHEVHHASTQHHGTSVLPTQTLDEFQRSGGNLHGTRTAKTGEFEDCPKPYNKEMQLEQLDGDSSMHKTPHTHSHGTSGTTSGPHDSKLANKADPRVDSDMSRQSIGQGNVRHDNTGGYSVGGTGAGQTGTSTRMDNGSVPRTGGVSDRTDVVGSGRNTHTTQSQTGTNTKSSNPSMLQKLNPFADADGDGKKGLMD